jgi:hypothetical protein
MRKRTGIVSLTLATAMMLAAATGAEAAVAPLVRVTGLSTLAAGCNGAPQTGTVYVNSEVEPWIAINPVHRNHRVAVWQQDRWSNGGAQANLTAISGDGGRTWARPTPPPFSRCVGGNADNGGDFERAADPWVDFAPNGDAHQIAVTFNNTDFQDGILVSSSRDGGRTWGPVVTLDRDATPQIVLDKQSLTADPTDSRYAYAVWTAVTFPNFPDLTTYLGPTRFARTVDGGATWQPVQVIFDPGGLNNQTLGNQIAVLPDGTLVNAFTWIIHDELHVGVQRSADKGRTWSEPVLVDRMRSLATVDPRDGALVRDGNLLLDVAVDPRAGSDDVYLVWQDARFTGDRRNQIALSRSSDGGRTWSRPTRVSQNLATQAFTPSVAVDADGNVGVTYYDFSFDTAASAALATDHWFTRSQDGGRTWSLPERVTGHSFDMRMAPNAGGYFLGDYIGLAADGPRFTPLFPVSLDDANPTDTLTTTVHPPFGALPSSGALLEPIKLGQPRPPGRLLAGAARAPLR